MRALWIGLGLVLSGLALLGALLPLMPSTVFALGAAGAFAKGSPRLEARLLAHPWLGPPLVAWRRDGAIAPAAKAVALGSMAVSAAITVAFAPMWVAVGTAASLAVSAGFVATRPSPALA